MKSIPELTGGELCLLSTAAKLHAVVYHLRSTNVNPSELSLMNYSWYYFKPLHRLSLYDSSCYAISV